jgi:hypothetical protein
MGTRRPLLLIVVPLALAACGGGGSTSVSGDPLGTASRTTMAQPSEKVSTEAKADLSGQTLKLGGDGAFDNRTQRGRLGLRFDFAGLGSSTADEVFAGRVVWIRSPLLTAALGGKQWVKVDLSKPAKAFGIDLHALAGQTPAAALAVLRRPGKVTEVGKNDVGGVSTTHYHVAFTGPRYRSADAWVDDQNLVRKVQLDYDATKGVKTLVTMTLSDFGAPVSAAPPAPADVTDLSKVSR